MSARDAMVIEADAIPQRYNALAFLSSWLIHTSYLFLPGTFTSLEQHLDDESGRRVIEAVKNVPLLWLAAICCIVGTAGLGYLWWTWTSNPVWLIRNVFLPETASSFLGSLNTLINVYSAQNGFWSPTAVAAMTINTVFLVGMLGSLLIYKYQLHVIDQSHLGSSSRWNLRRR